MLRRADRNRVVVNQPNVRTDERSVHFEAQNILLQVPKPPEWDTFSIEYGVVIAEKFASVATGGRLEGLMVSVFVTPLRDFAFDIPTSSVSRSTAADVLRQIVAEPDFVQNARVSPVFEMDWDDHDAAYYLLRYADLELVTMVLGVMLPDGSSLLTFTISAPSGQDERIREKLPELLDGLLINDMRLSAGVTDMLPDPLDWP